MKKKNHPDLKKKKKKTCKKNNNNGNDFGDEIKECLFVIFASYFTGGKPWGGTKGQINTLTNITGKKKRKNDFKKEGEGTQNFFLDRKTNPFESKELPET